MRTWQLSRTGQDPSVVVASTFVERFCGLAALVTLLPLALLQLPLFAYQDNILWPNKILVEWDQLDKKGAFKWAKNTSDGTKINDIAGLVHEVWHAFFDQQYSIVISFGNCLWYFCGCWIIKYRMVGA